MPGHADFEGTVRKVVQWRWQYDNPLRSKSYDTGLTRRQAENGEGVRRWAGNGSKPLQPLVQEMSPTVLGQDQVEIIAERLWHILAHPSYQNASAVREATRMVVEKVLASGDDCDQVAWLETLWEVMEPCIYDYDCRSAPSRRVLRDKQDWSLVQMLDTTDLCFYP